MEWQRLLEELKIHIGQTYGSATFGNNRDIKIAASKIPEGMRTLIGKIQGIYFRNLVIFTLGYNGHNGRNGCKQIYQY